jgi:acetyl-CoA carboxylase biotin carboxyl carrier protein
MFKFDEICELIRLVSSTKVASVEVEHAGTRVRIEGVPQGGAAQPAPLPSDSSPGPATTTRGEPTVSDAAGGASAPTGPLGTSGVVEPGAEEAAAEAAIAEEALSWVTSPIVGTFYRAPNPDSDPYAKVGDFVESGQTLCIVEAMKLMNEIESDVAGTIVKVLPQNAQPVEYGERLFGVRPA